MTRKSSTILTILLAIVMLLAACNSLEGDQAVGQRVPIKLTTSIAPTRGVQDEQIVSGQTVYVWAKAEDGGTADWSSGDCYIEAWKLTAGESGALTSANSTTYYYPPQSLSMVALHGNFDYTEGQTPFPAVVSHSVLSDQSTAGNLEQSDLLYARLNSVSASASPIGIVFAHKLSKIEITLSSSIYTDAEIDAMTVTLNNVLPTVDLSLTNGSLGAPHGNTIAVTPRRTATATANNGNAVYEAVIPAQTRPTDFITVRLNGGVVNVDAQVTEFEANKRYPYTVDLTYRDVRKNPLWYVAENNINYDYSATEIANSNTYDGSGTYSWATTPDEGFYFAWSDAVIAASKFSGWHLPSPREFASISPGFNTEGTFHNIFKLDDGSGDGTYKEALTFATFGYDNTTMMGITDDSYWVKISDTEVHALRFLGTDYCSAWKYVLDVANSVYIISATLVGEIVNSESSAKSWYDSYYNSVYFGNNEGIGAVQRFFYGRKYNTNGSTDTYNYAGGVMYGTYWSSNSNYRLWFGQSGDYGSHINGFTAAWGCSVRLFRDNREAHIRNNPLYYMSMYNVEFDGNGEFNEAGPYRFATTSNAGHFFRWSDARSDASNYTGMAYFGPTAAISKTMNYDNFYTRATEINGIGRGWHLPVRSEWLSILPVHHTYEISKSVFAYATEVGAGNYCNNYTTVVFGGCTTGITECAYWYRASNNEIWALRFLGTDYCSVWKYKISGGFTSSDYGVLQISSKLVPYVANTEAAARTALIGSDGNGGYKAQLNSDEKWGYIGTDPEAFDNVEEGSCRRTLYASGCTFGEAGRAPNPAGQDGGHIGTRGHWLTATRRDDGTFDIGFIASEYAEVIYTSKDLGCNVRLFRDNF